VTLFTLSVLGKIFVSPWLKMLCECTDLAPLKGTDFPAMILGSYIVVFKDELTDKEGIEWYF